MEEPIRKHMKAEASALEVQMENGFYSEDNVSKLCAEGAVRNLMNMLHCLRDELDTFWEMATMSVFALKDLLDDKKVPNSVIKGNLEVDSIEKCLWILQKKFHFCNNIKIEAILFPMCEAISKGTFGN